MSNQISIPEDLWEEDTEAVITSWLVSEGASVSKGTLIAEVMCEKVQYEIEAPAAGVIKILKEVDEIVSKGDVIGTVE